METGRKLYMNNTIYVTGHKHPDSDSICAAITMADLLNRLGKPAVACRQGPLNEETKFILKKFHQENPLLLTDARTMIRDIDIDPAHTISRHETVHHAWHVMLQTNNRSLFVTDDDGSLCGICTTSNLSMTRLTSDANINSLMAQAKLTDIAKTISGDVVVTPEDFHLDGVIHIITLEGAEAKLYPLKDGICLLSSDPEKQKMLMDEGAALLVITCGQEVREDVIEKAKKTSTAIIATALDTMHVARIISESYPIDLVMTKSVICFHEDEFIDDVAAKMTKSRVRSYPVLDENDRIVGAISRYHTLNYPHRKFVLVDHSAQNQSISHIEEADIQAIIDHHHIGGIQTSRPILYRNQKVGCTCTIISNLYQENGMLPDADMSGLLLSAILSDTLNFKSATTTDLDRLAASWLAKRAGIDSIDDYAREMLGASVSLKDASMTEILNRDLKNYTIGNFTFAIGQTNYSRMEEVQMILPAFKENMQKEQEEKRLDLMVMLFTDVMGEGSYFVWYGPMGSVISTIIQTQFDEHSGYDQRIISRKQQLMPMLSEALKNIG